MADLSHLLRYSQHFCNSYSCYMTAMKKAFLFFVHHRVFCCTGLKFSGRSVHKNSPIYLKEVAYLAPSVTSVLISSQGHHYLRNLYPSVTFGWNGGQDNKKLLGYQGWLKSSVKGNRRLWIIWPYLALLVQPWEGKSWLFLKELANPTKLRTPEPKQRRDHAQGGRGKDQRQHSENDKKSHSNLPHCV